MNSDNSGAGNNSEVIIEKEAPVKVRKRVRFAIDEAKEIAEEKKAKIDREEAFPVVTAEVIPKKSALKGPKNTVYRSNGPNVPIIFQELIKNMSSIKRIHIISCDRVFIMSLDDLEIRFGRNANGIIQYGDKANKKTITTTDPEKAIINHLWLVLKNPNSKFNFIRIQTSFVSKNPLINFERILSSMLDSFDHQLYTNELELDGLNEDTFISFLKRVEPKKLESISFNISWKEKGNYKKMKEIVESEQWKQANRVDSHGTSPLTVDDVLPFDRIYLSCDKISPEDVVRVREHFSKSLDKRQCTLSALRSLGKELHYEEFKNALQSKNLHARVIGINSIAYFYTLPNSKMFLRVTVSELDREVVFMKTNYCN